MLYGRPFVVSTLESGRYLVVSENDLTDDGNALDDNDDFLIGIPIAGHGEAKQRREKLEASFTAPEVCLASLVTINISVVYKVLKSENLVVAVGLTYRS